MTHATRWASPSKHPWQFAGSVLMVLAVLGSSASAAELFVSMKGSDGHNGSHTHPLLTVDRAQSLWKPGDEIVIRGRYSLPVVITKSGTKEHPLIVRGETYSVLGGRDMQRFGIYGDRVGYVTIRDLTIVNQLQAGVYFKRAHHVNLHNLRLRRNAYGVNFEWSEDVLIKDCVASRNIAIGIRYQGDRGTIADNTVCLTSLRELRPYACGKGKESFGIWVQGQDLTITGNSSFFNSKSGLRLAKSSRSVVQNNIISYNGVCGMELNTNCQENKVYGNICYLNSRYEINPKHDDAMDNEIYHNLFYGSLSAVVCNRGCRRNKFRNNIFCVTSATGEWPAIHLTGTNKYLANDFDYNLLSVPEGREISETDNRRKITTFGDFRDSGHERHGVFGKPIFRNAENFDFRLQEDSPGYRSSLDLGLGPVRGPQMEWFGPKTREVPMAVVHASSGEDTCMLAADGNLSTTWMATEEEDQYLLFEIDEPFVGQQVQYFRVRTASLHKTECDHIDRVAILTSDHRTGPFKEVYSGSINPTIHVGGALVEYFFNLCRLWDMKEPVVLKRFLKLSVQSLSGLNPKRKGKYPALSEISFLVPESAGMDGLSLGPGMIDDPVVQPPRIPATVVSASTGDDTCRFVNDRDVRTTWRASRHAGQFLIFEVDRRSVGKKIGAIRTCADRLRGHIDYIGEIELLTGEKLEGPFEKIYSASLDPIARLPGEPKRWHWQMIHTWKMEEPRSVKRYVKLKVLSNSGINYKKDDERFCPALSEMSLLEHQPASP